ncbi:MAG: DUF4932 domain-containing protein, partial [Armatimonadetes bacterium]|nr:DUF4932 domain-containing protein [Armatimonadota bacterium]NIM24164.1 DUF4932 domain-containing protein [Armatimonadota bacterium]NIM68023.1 DUF4932 domain-containing protein [Armatimonadota bacterium]NIM76518.1 DUF4932 domain-containing protein [Armatimonadota bacterium]NIN06257.1 DUF4932 domain-containing protein [Armatimonadota bacterium]
MRRAILSVCVVAAMAAVVVLLAGCQGPEAPSAPAEELESAELPKAAHAELPIAVTVDPRVELMSIIFRLTGSNEYTQGRIPSYTEDVDQHFGPYKEHPAVKMAIKLRSTRGVCFDAPMSMAVHLTDGYTLQERIPFDPHPGNLDKRWHLEEAREFLEKARQFVEDTDFQEFFEAHQPLYDQATGRMKEMLSKETHLGWFEE